MKKQTVINILAALAVIAGAVLVIAEQADLVGLPQYAYNIIYFIVVLPSALALSDICERLHPEYYSSEELRKKGLK